MSKILRLFSIILAISAISALAQDFEAPTKVTSQNRTGDLPFSSSIGTDLEHLDLGSGNLIVDVSIVDLHGRQMPFSFHLGWQGLFWMATLRGTSSGQQPGWRIEKRPYINTMGWTETSRAYLTWGVIKEQCGEVAGGDIAFRWTTNNYVFQDNQAAKHKFEVSTFEGNEAICGDDPNFQGDWTGFDEANAGMLARIPNVQSTPAIFLEDGSLVASSVSNESHIPHPNPNLPPDAFFGSVRDANGNSKQEFAGGLDTLGRVPVTKTGTNPVLYKVFDANGVERTYTVTWNTFLLQTNFNASYSGFGTIPEATCNACPLVTSIVLPNGQSYSFQYDTYGMLKQINLPTGGVITYIWSNFNDMESTHRYVSNRTVTANGQINAWNMLRICVQTFSTGGCKVMEVRVTDPLNNQSIYQFSNTGQIISAKIYEGSAVGTPLRQYDVLYQFSSPTVGEKPRGIRTTLENGLVSETQFDYNGHNVKEIREYDFGSGAPGPLLRRTRKNYLHTDHPDPNVRAEYVLRNIINRIIQETVDTGLSTPVLSDRKITYDNYTGFSTFASTSVAPQHDGTNYGPTFIYRGNPTKVEIWRNKSGFGLSDAAWLATEYKYDIFGNIRSIKDPLGHGTSWDYADAWQGTACLPPANSQALPSDAANAAGQHIRRTFYPCTYQVRSRKDQNDIDNARAGTVSVYEPMNRPFTIDYPDGGQTSFTYNDATLPLSNTKTVKHSASVSMVRTSVLDDLGRVKKTKLTSDPDGTVFTFMKYDALGRKLQEWNPSRCDQETSSSCAADTVSGVSTFGFTSYEYDALGRVKKLIPPDGTTSTNHVLTSFDGNATTVTDQAGKKRRTFTDALGRITQVDEPGVQP